MIMIIADDQRNAELVGPAHERLPVGAQKGFQYLEAHAGDRLLPNQGII